jgi:hypothetical protein
VSFLLLMVPARMVTRSSMGRGHDVGGILRWIDGTGPGATSPFPHTWNHSAQRNGTRMRRVKHEPRRALSHTIQTASRSHYASTDPSKLSLCEYGHYTVYDISHIGEGGCDPESIRAKLRAE